MAEGVFVDPVWFAKKVLATAACEVSHLKLQKLMFYAYGAARAASEAEPHSIVFHNWQHGPVCIPVYEYYRSFGAETLQLDDVATPLEGAARDAVRVYGALSAWQLRQESHLEDPWLSTPRGEVISDEAILTHFRLKFGSPVSAPRNLPGSWSLEVDSLPGLEAETLGELASAIGR